MKRREGFTLIELLVVIAIIALLLSILLPSLRIAKLRAQELICKSNMNQIGKAAITYASENDNKMRGAELATPDMSENIKSLWQLCYAPYLGGDSSEVERFWEIAAYNCPSYPNKSGIQTQDFCINAWRYEGDNVDGSELRGSVNVTALKNTGSKIHLSEYAYSEWQKNASGQWVDTGNKLSGVKIVTPEDYQGLDTPAQQKNLLSKLIWMDVRFLRHLPNATAEAADRRVSRGRHKKTGTNNLFFDGHVEWLDREENDASKWWLKGQHD